MNFGVSERLNVKAALVTRWERARHVTLLSRCPRERRTWNDQIAAPLGRVTKWLGGVKSKQLRLTGMASSCNYGNVMIHTSR